jgi:hypothetical protein
MLVGKSSQMVRAKALDPDGEKADVSLLCETAEGGRGSSKPPKAAHMADAKGTIGNRPARQQPSLDAPSGSRGRHAKALDMLTCRVYLEQVQL